MSYVTGKMAHDDRLGQALGVAAATLAFFAVAVALGMAVAIALLEILSASGEMGLGPDPLVLVGVGATLAGTVFGASFVGLVRWRRSIRPRLSPTAIGVFVIGAVCTALLPFTPIWLAPLGDHTPLFNPPLWWWTMFGAVYFGSVGAFFCLGLRLTLAAPLSWRITVGCLLASAIGGDAALVLVLSHLPPLWLWLSPGLLIAMMAGSVSFVVPPSARTANSVAR